MITMAITTTSSVYSSLITRNVSIITYLSLIMRATIEFNATTNILSMTTAYTPKHTYSTAKAWIAHQYNGKMDVPCTLSDIIADECNTIDVLTMFLAIEVDSVSEWRHAAGRALINARLTTRLAAVYLFDAQVDELTDPRSAQAKQLVAIQNYYAAIDVRLLNKLPIYRPFSTLPGDILRVILREILINNMRAICTLSVINKHIYIEAAAIWKDARHEYLRYRPGALSSSDVLQRLQATSVRPSTTLYGITLVSRQGVLMGRSIPLLHISIYGPRVNVAVKSYNIVFEVRDGKYVPIKYFKIDWEAIIQTNWGRLIQTSLRPRQEMRKSIHQLITTALMRIVPELVDQFSLF